MCLSVHSPGVVFQVPRSQSGQLPPITFSSDMFMQWDLCWEGRRGNNRWQVEYNQGPEGVTLLEYHTVISLFDLCISLHVPILYTIKSTENILLNCLIVWLPNQHKRHGRALFVCSSCWAAGQYPNSPLIMGLSLSITVKAHATHNTMRHLASFQLCTLHCPSHMQDDGLSVKSMQMTFHVFWVI